MVINLEIAKKRPSGMIFLLYSIFLLLPVYFNSPGLPQLVDIPIVLLLLYFLSKKNLAFYTKKNILCPYCIVLYFLIIQLLLELGHLFIGNNDSSEVGLLVLYNFYFIISYVTFSFAFERLYGVGNISYFYRTIINCALISFVIPAFSLLDHVSFVSRNNLTFNDANQMIFFTLLNVSILYYATLLIRKSRFVVKPEFIKSFIILFLGLGFIFLSASRTGLLLFILWVVCLFLVLTTFELGKLKPLYKIILLVLCLLAVLYIYLQYIHHLNIVRLYIFNSGVTTTDFYVRAINGISYDISNLSVVLFGTGLSRRFGGDLEYHNNYIGIFHQVGVFPLILYVVVCFIALVRLYKKGFLYTIPFLTYVAVSCLFFTMRNRMNWILLAFIFLIASLPITKINAKNK